MPIAIRALPASAGANPSRSRMSTAVTIRPRKLSMPANSGAASGTRVRRSGMNTSCTPEIGRPNSWPPIVAVTYSMVCSVVLIARSCRAIGVGGLLLERRDQALAVEFGDVVVQADLAATLDRLRRGQRRKPNHRDRRRPRILLDRRGKVETVHAGHVEIG